MSTPITPAQRSLDADSTHQSKQTFQTRTRRTGAMNFTAPEIDKKTLDETKLITAISVGGLEVRRPSALAGVQSQQERAAAVVTALNAAPPAKLLAKTQKGLVHSLAIELAFVWSEFENQLHSIPLLNRLDKGTITREDYKNLLLTWCQQSINGGRWLIRAAGSSIATELFPIRSVLVDYGVQEQKDLEKLKQDFYAMGGKASDIYAEDKNIGSDALSGYLFHEAGQENPLAILGAVFIIESLMSLKAKRWIVQLKNRLELDDTQLSFLSHYADNSDLNYTRLRGLLSGDYITAKACKEIVQAAKVTAKLYTLQFQEIALEAVNSVPDYESEREVMAV